MNVPHVNFLLCQRRPGDAAPAPTPAHVSTSSDVSDASSPESFGAHDLTGIDPVRSSDMDELDVARGASSVQPANSDPMFDGGGGASSDGWNGI